MAPVTFLLDPEHYKQVSHLTRVEEFTLHIPPLIWEWATYFHLKNAGHNVCLTDKMPDAGIVVVSACIYPLMKKPPQNVLLISTLADSPPRFFAHVNVSQNPVQHRDYPNLFEYPIWRHINIWPQPGIIPRDPARGERFERIGFFGHYDQLERSLQRDEFKEALAKRGLTLKIVDRDFCDYSDVDAVIAVRDYTGNPQLHKPASKLINAWSAGVPLLTTGETAYKAIQKSSLDFIEISNTEELLAGFDKLKADPGLVKKMAANGQQRVQDFTQEKILNEWEMLLFEEAQAYYKKWMKKSRLQKDFFLADQLMSRSFRSVKNRIKKRLQKS
jgi:hypothetical protein